MAPKVRKRRNNVTGLCLIIYAFYLESGMFSINDGHLKIFNLESVSNVRFVCLCRDYSWM